MSKRLLSELRVMDLRVELEKRNLSKSGVRGVLLQRLEKSLEEEGHDPATFVFEINLDSDTPSKRSRRSDSTVEGEPEEAPAMEDMVVQDHVGEEDDGECVKKEEMEVEENKNTRKRENSDTSEGGKAKKACVEKTAIKEEKAENNTDADDSINLDIGDDELLNDEADHTAKCKKDEEEAATEGEGAATAGDKAAAVAVKEEGNTEDLATSENGEGKKDKSSDEKEEDKKEKKDDGGPRNLWVSGLSGDTRAKDLKQLCSKHGKVVGAKVVTNAKTPGSRCYGYVTMATAQDADNCIKSLHRTELHGRLISVEKAKSESESGSRKQPRDRRSSKDGDSKEEIERKDDKSVEGKVKKDDEEADERGRSISENRDKHREKSDSRGHRTRSREHRRTPQREVLSFSKIWKERDMARARERSRMAREDERRRRAAEDALRERERRQRQEKHRLEMERESLRAEREKIEREKNELLRLERERHRLEREKLELERLELKRAQIRLEEERRKRSNAYESNSYRKTATSPPPAPAYDRDARHKRAPPPPMMSSRGQFEAPPPPRFEMVTPAYERAQDKRDRDYKREYPRHVSSTAVKYPSNGNTNDDSRQPLPPGTIRAKEPSRVYETRDTRSYRNSPPAKPEQRTWNPSNRYPDSSSIPSKGFNKERITSGSSEQWSSNTNSSDARYGNAGYETRYPTQYPPPPATQYTDRYQQQTRDYRTKY